MVLLNDFTADEIHFPSNLSWLYIKSNLHRIGINNRYLAPLRALLPSHWEYHFLQGPLECGPAPGIGEIYPSQTYNCWFHVPSLTEFQSVHDLLEEVIEEEGPFDVSWGFSAVRLTFELHLKINLFFFSSSLMSSSSPLIFYQSHPLQHKPDHRGKV